MKGNKKLSLPQFMTRDKATVIKTVRYWQKEQTKGSTDKTETQIRPHKYGQLASSQGAKATPGSKESLFSTRCWNTWTSTRNRATWTQTLHSLQELARAGSQTQMQHTELKTFLKMTREKTQMIPMRHQRNDPREIQSPAGLLASGTSVL